ncbi:hypothetical protein L798_05276 [Zootermopsis nevadensis]|uniref:Uncharacterized protein n=1 Tax=Zootermopsis nevadensis TaxID=136037 RepID=A0A067RRN3_ZOONE|nr:hypothetical protein L798_05276 [Zootermopsis nevadensis]
MLMEGQKKTMQNISQESLSPDQDSNPEPQGYKTEVKCTGKGRMLSPFIYTMYNSIQLGEEEEKEKRQKMSQYKQY